MDLDRYDLSRWEKDILIEFNNEDAVEDLMDCVHDDIDVQNNFLIRLADSINLYKSLLRIGVIDLDAKAEFEKMKYENICPYCKTKDEMVAVGEYTLMCGNCDRVVAYCEGIGIYEETDE